MKYLLWAGDNYYPGSGLRDFKGFFPTVEEAEAFAKSKRPSAQDYPFVYDWYTIVEHATMRVIKQESNSNY